MSRRFSALAAFTVLLGVGVPASAQLRYTSTTRLELGGAMGRMASMMPGLGDPTEEVTSIQGSNIRHDAGTSSTIVDWNTGAMTILDHEARTFVRFDFAQMAEGMATAFQQGATQAPAEDAGRDAESRPEIQAEISVDRTGKSERIAGYQADQVFLTLTLAPTDEAVEENPEMEGAALAVVTELWLSTDFPEAALMEAMRGEAMDRMRETFSAQGGAASSMEAMSAFDPRLKDAWAKNAEELSKLEGTALRTTMHFVSVPPGAELDRDRVLADAEKSLASDAAGAAAAGAADAAKKALGGLAGRFGRGKKEEPKEEEAPAATQSVFLRAVTEIGDVKTGDLDASLFVVPDGYTEQTSPTGG